eukprot:3819093-Pleurochrysis_carterae.AAC.2
MHAKSTSKPLLYMLECKRNKVWQRLLEANAGVVKSAYKLRISPCESCTVANATFGQIKQRTWTQTSSESSEAKMRLMTACVFKAGIQLYASDPKSTRRSTGTHACHCNYLSSQERSRADGRLTNRMSGLRRAGF